MSQNKGGVSQSINLNGLKFKTVTDAYNLQLLNFHMCKVLYSANIEISYSNVFGASNSNGYHKRVFTMFQKFPDVQRLQKIIMHLQILKPGNVKAKDTKNLTQQRGNISF